MNKTVYRLFLAVITIFCIIVGVYGHRRFSNETVVTETSEVIYSGEELLEESYRLYPFTKIDVVLPAGTVLVSSHEDTDYTVFYQGPESMRPKCFVEDGTLYVQPAYESDITPHDASGEAQYRIGCGGYGLENCSVHLDVGTVKLDNIECAETAVSCDTGTVECSYCTFGDVSYKIDIGDIRLFNISFRQMDANIDTGEAEIIPENGIEGMKIRLETGLGNILINNEKEGSLWEHAAGSADAVSEMKVFTEVGNIILSY